MSFKITDEQRTALDAFETGDNMVISAYAGSGKTSTLKLLSEESKLSTRLIFLAYNTATAADADQKFPGNTNCRTAHSFAFGAVGKHYKSKLDAPRMRSRDMCNIMGIHGALDVTDKVPAKLAAWVLARHVMDTIKRFCYSADPAVARQHVPFIPGVNMDTLCSYIVPIARRAWEDLITVDGGNLSMHKNHDIYLKLWALAEPKLPGDIIMLDEAQDTNPCVTKVVMDQKAQQIMVGDGNQQIYAWRGAVDAMETFSADHRVSLTQSFRFGDAIAQEANVWLRKLGNTLPLRGFDQIPSTIERLENPHAILCRTNAQVIAEAMERHERGQAFAIVGGTAEIRRFAEGAQDLMNGKSAGHPDLVAFGNWQDVRDFVTDEQDNVLKVLVKMIDTYGVERVIDVADSACPERQADIILSTAHKAKGREWLTVKIANDFEPMDFDPTKPNKSENMLAYVATTRAQLKLDNEGLVWGL